MSCPGYPEDDSHREETPPPEYPATDPEEAPPPNYQHAVLDEKAPPDYHSIFITTKTLPFPGKNKMSCHKTMKTASAEIFPLVDFTLKAQNIVHYTEKKTPHMKLPHVTLYVYVAKTSITKLKLMDGSKDEQVIMVEEGDYYLDVYSQLKCVKTSADLLEMLPICIAKMSFSDHQSPPSREVTLLSLMSSTGLHEMDEKVSSNVRSLPGPTVCQGNNEDGQVLWPESNITSQNFIHNDLKFYYYGGTDRAKAVSFVCLVFHVKKHIDSLFNE
jgi:hypothetical protein